MTYKYIVYTKHIKRRTPVYNVIVKILIVFYVLFLKCANVCIIYYKL